MFLENGPPKQKQNPCEWKITLNRKRSLAPLLGCSCSAGRLRLAKRFLRELSWKLRQTVGGAWTCRLAHCRWQKRWIKSVVEGWNAAVAADHPPAWHAIRAPRVPGFELQPQALSLQLTASSKAWLRLLQLAGGAADPCSSPTGSLVAKHYWDPTDLNKFSSWFRLSWSQVPQKSFPAVFTS